MSEKSAGPRAMVAATSRASEAVAKTAAAHRHTRISPHSLASQVTSRGASGAHKRIFIGHSLAGPSAGHLRRSGLLDVPQKVRGRLDDPLQVFVISGHRLPLSGRNIGYDLEGALLDRGGKLLALVERRRPDPLASQRLELVVARPPEPRVRPVRL